MGQIKFKAGPNICMRLLREMRLFSVALQLYYYKQNDLRKTKLPAQPHAHAHVLSFTNRLAEL